MMFFICIFIPAIFSMVIDKRIYQSQRNICEFILVYFCYLFIITALMNTVFFITEGNICFYSIKTFTYGFFTKYMWTSLIISILIPYVIKCFRQVISIDIEIRKKKQVMSKEKIVVKEVSQNEKKKIKKNKSKKSTQNNH